MRRLVVALVAATVALTLAGCGGGGEEAPTTTAPTTTQPPAAPAAAPVAAGRPGETTIDRSTMSTESFVPFQIEGDMPLAVKERLDTEQAMLIFFYNGAQKSTDDLRSQVNAVLDEYRGNIDLITYDLGKYTSTNATGIAIVDVEKLAGDEKGKEAVRFARQVGVNHLPYIIIVDNQGFKIFTVWGFIDEQLLSRQVYRATR